MQLYKRACGARWIWGRGCCSSVGRSRLFNSCREHEFEPQQCMGCISLLFLPKKAPKNLAGLRPAPLVLTSPPDTRGTRPAPRCRPKTIFRLWCQLLKLSQSDINCVECGDEVHAFSLHTQLQKFSSRGSAPHPSWSNGTCGPWTNEHCENFCVTEICNRHRIWPTLSAGPDPARATPRPPPMGRGGAVGTGRCQRLLEQPGCVDGAG